MIAELKNSLKNLDFEKMKAKGKPLGIAAICFIAVFAAGFGIGQSGGQSSASPTKRSTNTNNYTTNSNGNTKPPTPTAKTTTAVDPANCKIKGSKSKIYHMPGGSFYERTNPAACFETEEEAQAAGYTKSSR